MTWRASPKLVAYVALVAVGVVGGFAAGRPEPVVLVVPLAVVIVAGLSATRRAQVAVRRATSRDVALEGDRLVLSIEIESSDLVRTLEVAPVLPGGVSIDDAPSLVGVTLRAGASRRLEIPLRCDRWGAYRLGETVVRAGGLLGLLVAVGRVDGADPLRVYPRPESIRGLVQAKTPRAAAGNQRTRVKGSGIEFADIRPFVAGDRARDVNWRASARRSSLWVNERHPDRSTDVVLFLDVFSELALDDAARAANALATAYLAYRDRVGIVSFGGVVRWLRPGTGLRQQYLIVHMLLETKVYETEARRELDHVVPPRVLPAQALVVAISTLLDERTLKVLVELRTRGIDVVAIEVPVVPYVSPARGVAGDAAYRLWKLSRDARRDRLRELGIPVAEWSEHRSLAEVVEEVAAWPRARGRVG